MDKISLAAAYAVAHWGAVLLWLGAIISFLGTVQNLLSHFNGPKAQKARGLVGKALDVFSFVAERGAHGPFALLPGPLGDLLKYLSAPGFASKPVLGVRDAGGVKAIVPLLLAASTAGMLLAGCPAAKSVAINIAACAVGQVPSAVTDIIPDVQKALEGTGVDWASSLEGIGIKAGVDALACAIKSILGGYAHAELPAPKLWAMARGQAWLEAHGYEKAARHAQAVIPLKEGPPIHIIDHCQISAAKLISYQTADGTETAYVDMSGACHGDCYALAWAVVSGR